jgi:hypothetical protein
MTVSIAKYEETIENLSCYAMEGCGNTPWPVGVPPPFKPPTRFDVLRWDYFNETHIYLKTDDTVIDPMKRMFFFEIKKSMSFSLSKMKIMKMFMKLLIMQLSNYRKNMELSMIHQLSIDVIFFVFLYSK